MSNVVKYENDEDIIFYNLIHGYFKEHEKCVTYLDELPETCIYFYSCMNGDGGTESRFYIDPIKRLLYRGVYVRFYDGSTKLNNIVSLNMKEKRIDEKLTEKIMGKILWKIIEEIMEEKLIE